MVVGRRRRRRRRRASQRFSSPSGGAAAWTGIWPVKEDPAARAAAAGRQAQRQEKTQTERQAERILRGIQAREREAGRQTGTCVWRQCVPERCCWAAAISVLCLCYFAARRIVVSRPWTDSKTLRREATARNLLCGFACGSLKGVMHKDHAAWTQQENRDNMEKQPRYSRSSTESNYCRTHNPFCQPVKLCQPV